MFALSLSGGNEWSHVCTRQWDGIAIVWSGLNDVRLFHAISHTITQQTDRPLSSLPPTLRQVRPAIEQIAALLKGLGIEMTLTDPRLPDFLHPNAERSTFGIAEKDKVAAQLRALNRFWAPCTPP